MFLSDRARDAYFALQDAIVAAVGTPTSGSTGHAWPLRDEAPVRRASSRLRTVLTADLGSRQKPLLEGDRDA